jgi:PIN domain nuclease of toxin-antitoxin system
VKLLLDTHIWLWSHLEPEKLADQVTSQLRNPDNEIWLSPISVWELILLVKKGRVSLGEAASDWIRTALTRKPMKEAALTTEVTLAILHTQLSHRDPADLFLAATAKVLDLTLVTADVRLLDEPGLSTLANR